MGDWAYRPLVLTDSSGGLQRSIVRNQVVLHPGASVVLFDRLRLSLDLPVQVFADGHTVTYAGTTYAGPSNAQAIGDLRIGADLRLFGAYGDAITGAIGLDLYAPTGSQGSYTSDGSVRIAPRVLIAGDVGPFVYAAKLGVMARTGAIDFGSSQVGTNIFFGASAGVRVLDKKLVVGPEIFGNSVVTNSDFFTKQATPSKGCWGRTT